MLGASVSLRLSKKPRSRGMGKAGSVPKSTSNGGLSGAGGAGAALGRDGEGGLVAEEHVERRIVRAGGHELGHPFRADAGDDLDLHVVLLLEGLHERLLHHVGPAAAIAGDHERGLLGVHAGHRGEQGDAQGDQGDDTVHERASAESVDRAWGWAGYSVLTTSAGHARASTRACHSLILPSGPMITPTRCAPFCGSTLAP